MNVHYSSSYFTDSPHPISVYLIGCGGTGSQVLSGLARMNFAMQALGHPGLHVTAFDHDTVSETNVGRQLFSPSDIGLNKASVLITRINRFFGTGWNSIPSAFNHKSTQKIGGANLIISCIDTAAGRIKINDTLQKHLKGGHDEQRCLYWMDFGNGRNTGQVILGTLNKIHQPTSKYQTFEELPTVLEQFPEMASIVDDDEGPSCSIAQALGRQGLFVNSTLAQLGCNLLWELISDVKIVNRGMFLNLATMSVNPIKI